MDMPLRVERLKFNGRTEVDTSSADIVVLVGPNNSGKTRVLTEIQMTMSLQPGQTLHPAAAFALTDVEFAAGDAAYAKDWLRSKRRTWTEPTSQDEMVRTIGAGDQKLLVLDSWWRGDGRCYQMAPHFSRSMFCGDRLGYLGMPPRPVPGQGLDHPIQVLATDEGLLERFRSRFRRAFSRELIVDAWGPNVQLRVSEEHTQSDFIASSASGLPPADMIDRLTLVPAMETQSDGVRSFAGVLLTLLTTEFPVVLLDEPEAFLHPPQARLLGRYLSELRQGGQVFLATHSLDVLLGIVEARPERVLIVRLTRAAGETTARTLTPDELKRIWADPLLKFSRALDGIFHEGVIVCEGDTDTLFYSAVMNSLSGSDSTEPDLMLTFAGGKHRIPLVVESLRALGVPVAVIADFDVLNDERIVRRLLASLGTDLDDRAANDRAVVDAGLRGHAASLTRGSIRAALAPLLEGSDTEVVTSTEWRSAREAVDPPTGWKAARTAGRSAVPAGDATAALERLLETCKQAGLFVVPSGAVESFVRSVPNVGPRWVMDVVEGGHVDSAAEAKAFVNEVVSFFVAR